jgi:hypothetical protein
VNSTVFGAFSSIGFDSQPVIGKAARLAANRKAPEHVLAIVTSTAVLGKERAVPLG